MASRIEDYALIGDTYAAGLVGKDGSIDWLCVPRFDSGACFAALLGDRKHGRWLLAPVSESRATSRRYRDDTLILETEFECPQGAVRVIDCMSPRQRRRWMRCGRSRTRKLGGASGRRIAHIAAPGATSWSVRS